MKTTFASHYTKIISLREALDPAIRTALMAEYSSQAGEKLVASEETRVGINTFVNVVPRNPVASAAKASRVSSYSRANSARSPSTQRSNSGAPVRKKPSRNGPA